MRMTASVALGSGYRLFVNVTGKASALSVAFSNRTGKPSLTNGARLNSVGPGLRPAVDAIERSRAVPRSWSLHHHFGIGNSRRCMSGYTRPHDTALRDDAIARRRASSCE